MTGNAIDKTALRRDLRARRQRFVGDAPTPLAPTLELTALFRPGQTVASYVPIGSEADPALLAEAARAHGCRIALPVVVDRATPIVFVRWSAEMPLMAGPFGLRQPPSGEPIVPDLILTPLLGFDRRLNRLGQGAGHYDRAFATWLDAYRIGVAWSIQEVNALPADPWDMPLHAILTEKEWITQ